MTRIEPAYYRTTFAAPVGPNSHCQFQGGPYTYSSEEATLRGVVADDVTSIKVTLSNGEVQTLDGRSGAITFTPGKNQWITGMDVVRGGKSHHESKLFVKANIDKIAASSEV